MNRRYLSFLSIPALIIIIAVLYFAVKPSIFHDPAWLIPITDMLFITFICFAVAVIAIRVYGATGRTHAITVSLSPAEEKFRALAENSPNMIDRFDKRLKHIYMNSAGLRLHGKPATAIIGKTIEETGVPEPYCSLWKERIQKVFTTGQPLVVEEYFPAADGERFHQSRCVPEYGADGAVAHVLVVSHDLTERKRAEEALRRTKDELERTFDSVPDLIAILDNDHRILRVNRAMARRLGHAPEECVGLHCYEVVHGVNEPPVFCPHLRTLKDGREHNEAVHEVRLGGDFLISTTPLHDGQGLMIGSVHVAHNITERKRAEEAIARRNDILTGINRIFKEALACESEEELAESCLNVAVEITGSLFGFIGFIGVDGLFHDVAISETGWDACAMYGRSGERRQPGNLHIHGIYGRVLLDGKSFFTNAPNLHPDSIGVPEGHPAITAFIGVPLKSGGKTIGMVGLGNREGGYRNEDLEAAEALAVAIVESLIRKRAEKKVLKLIEEKALRNAELEALNKELEAFTYSVSHDLRTPLRSINGFSHALMEDCADKLDEEGKKSLERILAATGHMGRLIDDLLNLSRMTRIEMTRKMVNLSEIGHEIIGKLKETEPNRQAEFIIEGGLFANGDQGLLRAAMENLLGNAWKFTDRQSHAVIEFGVTTCDGRDTYFVRDNGAGFDMAYADKLFNPFQRLHSTEQYPGTGIGLATVKRIVNRHGGRVWAEGEVGKGATVYFTLE